MENLEAKFLIILNVFVHFNVTVADCNALTALFKNRIRDLSCDNRANIKTTPGPSW